MDFLRLLAGVTLSTVCQYLVVAGGFQLALRLLAKTSVGRRKIQTQTRPSRVMRQEIRHSLSSCVVFAVVGALTTVAYQRGYTREYDHVADFGWGYLAFSIWAMFTIHDIWHYALHRLSHEIPLIYRYAHRTHHAFGTPSSWSADAFHPLDALINISFLPLLAFALPIHAGVFHAYLVLAVILNTLGHSGYELMPAGLSRHWLLRYLNTTTAHDMHHQKVRYNYGLYTNILDRALGTFHPDTLATYERAASGQAAGGENDGAAVRPRLPTVASPALRSS